MARRTSQAQLLRRAVRSFLDMPWKYQAGIVLVALVGILIWYLVTSTRSPYGDQPPITGTNPDGSGTYQFCVWNVENLFDDSDDDRNSIDDEYDNAFAQNAALRQEKYDRIAGALLGMNGGRGPDVIACVEVETIRAAELLRETLNRKLAEAGAEPHWQYTQVAMKNLDGGRHIAPCLITRLNVAHSRTRQPDRRLRVLEAQVGANGHDLLVIVSHWTSKRPQPDGSDGSEGRARYARLIHDLYSDAVSTDPDRDVVVCGDFNDPPGAASLTEMLHAISDRARVVPGTNPPLLLDLLAGKPPEQFGTIWYSGDPLIYDNICVSPGMLNLAGWSCEPDSIRVPTEGLIRLGSTRREPWRFGSPANPPTGGRGYSDHFPVTLTLRAAPAPQAN